MELPHPQTRLPAAGLSLHKPKVWDSLKQDAQLTKDSRVLARPVTRRCHLHPRDALAVHPHTRAGRCASASSCNPLSQLLQSQVQFRREQMLYLKPAYGRSPYTEPELFMGRTSRSCNTVPCNGTASLKRRRRSICVSPQAPPHAFSRHPKLGAP